jgi:UDP-GlcNAc:undecaprenyl-phosphate/decaprenyl-phosphate GlcNAc-1-phosphate transferase
MELFFGIPLVLTLLMTPSVIWLAGRCGCVDYPGGRRVHAHPTPRWGGLAFFAGLLPIFLLLDVDQGLLSYLAASFLLVALGAIDDWKPLGFSTKLLGILAAITIVIFSGGIVIRHIGTYGSFGTVYLGALAIPFTYLAIVGVTNAINLIDGLNGLAGGISFLASLFLGIAAYMSGNYTLTCLCLGFAGALGAFLRFNMLARARIFMGDSGSLFLGFSLSVFSIMLTQEPKYHIEPMLPVMVLFIPIFDTLRVMGTRAFAGRNPFKADMNHLHHLLVKAGHSQRKSVIFLWSLSGLFGLAALALISRGTSMPYLAVVLGAAFVLNMFADSLIRRQARMRLNQDIPASTPDMMPGQPTTR